MARLRFSLKTLLLLVTISGVFTCWLTYQLSWIKQRQNAVKWLAESQNRDCWIAPSLVGAPIQANAPWNLRILGTSGVVAIGIPNESEETDRPPFSRAELRRLFPEARVDWSVNGRMWDHQED